jgi:hypothetical protein
VDDPVEPREAGSLHVLSDIPVQVSERDLLRTLRIPRLETLDELPQAGLRDDLGRAVVRGLSLARAQATVRWMALPWSEDHVAAPRAAHHIFVGDSVRRWFAGCRRVTLMVVTVGEVLDFAVEELEREAIGQAYHLDAVGSVLAESAADAVDADISRAIRRAGYEPTHRRSPGYADWPIEIQSYFLHWCDAARLGVRATADHVLVPSKSITAAIGWREREET